MSVLCGDMRIEHWNNSMTHLGAGPQSDTIRDFSREFSISEAENINSKQTPTSTSATSSSAISRKQEFVREPDLVKVSSRLTPDDTSDRTAASERTEDCFISETNSGLCDTITTALSAISKVNFNETDFRTSTSSVISDRRSQTHGRTSAANSAISRRLDHSDRKTYNRTPPSATHATVSRRQGRRSVTSPLVSDATVCVEREGARTICSNMYWTTEYGQVHYPMPCSREQVVSTSRPMAQEGGRQRMRPWLEYHINNRTTPGLLWIDTQQKLFRVPWKHVGNRDWTETDGTIFKMWAHHTGKYRENIDQPDWPTWKTRFRCALTKLPDIKERKELNRLDGQTDEPYRVYQFVARSNNENIDPGRKSHEDMYMDESSMQQETFTPDQSSQRLPTVLLSSSSEHQQSADPQLDSDLNNIEVGDLMKLNSSDMRECIQNDTELMEGVDDTGGEGSLKGIRDIGRKCYPGQTRPNYINIKDDWTIDHTDCKLYIVVKYLLLRVIEKLCSNPNGCRIFYDKFIRFANKQEFTEMYGSPGVEPIYLPECENMMQAQQQKLTLDLLHAADRGLILTVRNGSIFATRNCRCRVYISTPSIDNGEVIKLDRDQETNIFDLDKYFRPALDRYIQQSGPKPSAEVIIGFGQHFKNDRESINDLLVSVSVVHTEAYSLLTRICCSNPTDLPIDLSNSDDKDRAMDIVQHQQQYEQQSQMI